VSGDLQSLGQFEHFSDRAYVSKVAGLCRQEQRILGVSIQTVYLWVERKQIRGLQVSLLLVNRGEPKGDGDTDIDFLMRYKPSGQFIVQPTEAVSAIVPQTAILATVPVAAPQLFTPVSTMSLRAGLPDQEPMNPRLVAADVGKTELTSLDDLLERQRRAPLPMLYGQKPGVSPPGKELIRAGVSEVIDQGTAVVVAVLGP
jgi:hypothetical protein